MDISDKVRKQKRMDQKQYYRSIKNMYDVIEGKGDSLFFNYENDGIKSQILLLLRYFGMQDIKVSEDVPKEQGVEYMLDAANIMSRNVRLKGEWWKQDATPLMCTHKENGQMYLLLPGKFGGLYYFDEKKRKRERVTKEVAKQFEADALCFYRPFSAKKMTVFDLLLELNKTLKAADYLFLLFTTLAVTLLGLVLPLVNNYIFQFVIPSGEKGDIPYVVILLLGVVIASSMFVFFRMVWIARIGDKIKNAAESALWNRILNLPAQFFKEHDSGELTSRAMLLGQLCEVVTGAIIPVLLTTVFSVVYLVQVRAFSTKLLGPTLLIMSCMFGFSCLNSMFVIRINQKKNKINTALSGFVYQLYQAIGTIKVHGAEVRAFSKWSQFYRQKMAIKPNVVVKFADSINLMISLGGSILIYRTVYKNGIGVSAYISFQVAFGLLIGVLLQFSGMITQLAFIKPAVEMILPFFDCVPEKQGGKERITHLDGKIEISNVCFRYSPEMEDVLHNLSLTIYPGEYVALVGSSGCGKSTLFRVLLGFEKTDRGAVYFDDKDMEDLDLQSVRKRIGTVLQDGMLFYGDIYSNISLCAPELTLDQAWEAAKKAGCAEDIENMPMGMFTMVSDGGGGISGGQKQRILIARALAMDPDILLFDEATSALDNITQKRVVESLAEKKVTRVVIAHRLSTIKDCDRIIYLHKGTVAEQGTYEELMELKGKFYELAKWQLV